MNKNTEISDKSFGMAIVVAVVIVFCLVMIFYGISGLVNGETKMILKKYYTTNHVVPVGRLAGMIIAIGYIGMGISIPLLIFKDKITRFSFLINVIVTLSLITLVTGFLMPGFKS